MIAYRNWLLFCVLAILCSRLAAVTILPLAPYNIKLFCYTGKGDTSTAMVPIECPSSSATCALFQFNLDQSHEKLSTYECIDSSIISSVNEEEEGLREEIFGTMCNERAMCHFINYTELNKEFFKYLLRANDIADNMLIMKTIKFCCGVGYGMLDQLLSSGLNEISEPTTEEKHCCKERCRSGALGCLTFDGEQSVDEFDDPFYIQSYSHHRPHRSHQIRESSNDCQCVYRHFNDELYRYCLMIRDRNSSDLCLHNLNAHICCCFIAEGQKTCSYDDGKSIPLKELQSRGSKFSIVMKPLPIEFKTDQAKSKMKPTPNQIKRINCKSMIEPDRKHTFVAGKLNRVICEVNSSSDKLISKVLYACLLASVLLFQSSLVDKL